MKMYLWRYPNENKGHNFYNTLLNKIILSIDLEYCFRDGVSLKEPVELEKLKYQKFNIFMRMEHEPTPQESYYWTIGSYSSRSKEDHNEMNYNKWLEE